MDAEAGTTQRAIARRLGFNESAITAPVGRIEVSGALARHRHPDDGRVRLLSVTAEGRRALAEALDKLGADFVPPADE